MGKHRLVARCPVLFLLAIAFDIGGLSLILVGVFVNLEKDGRSFGEFLIFSGGILVFFSLLWWLAWYSFNLEVSMEELLMDLPAEPKKSSLVQLARKFSERFSKRGRRKVLTMETHSTANQSGVPEIGSPAIFINGGFDTQNLKDKHLEMNPLPSPDTQLVVCVQEMEERLV